MNSALFLDSDAILHYAGMHWMVHYQHHYPGMHWWIPLQWWIGWQYVIGSEWLAVSQWLAIAAGAFDCAPYPCLCVWHECVWLLHMLTDNEWLAVCAWLAMWRSHVHACDMTPSHVDWQWVIGSVCLTGNVKESCSCVWHDSFTGNECRLLDRAPHTLVDMYDMTPSHLWHESSWYSLERQKS